MFELLFMMFFGLAALTIGIWAIQFLIFIGLMIVEGINALRVRRAKKIIDHYEHDHY